MHTERLSSWHESWQVQTALKALSISSARYAWRESKHLHGWRTGNDGHNSTLDADTLDTYHASSFALLSGPTFTGHVKVGTTNTYDIGEAGVKWRRTLYVGNIVADTISGTSLSGATWRNDASDMGIYSRARLAPAHWQSPTTARA